MTWAVIALIALAAFAALVLVFKAPRRGWEAIGATLLLGIAGFALQARPDLPGAPKAPAQSADKSGEALVAARKALSDSGAAPASNWTVTADAFARRGQYGDAAGLLLGAVQKEPRNADAWVALGNALVGHGEGALTPAVLFAYRKAAEADPAHPGPSFFLGLALAQSGRLAEGRALWADLLARAPAGAPWRKDLAERLARLDAFIVMQEKDAHQ